MPPHVHKLSEIDREARTAVCANCGPVRIRLKPGSSPDKPRVAKCSKAVAAQRKPYLRHRGGCCSRCGFEPEDECQLDVHHIDHDHFNNSVENLVTLCANCHRLEHK